MKGSTTARQLITRREFMRQMAAAAAGSAFLAACGRLGSADPSVVAPEALSPIMPNSSGATPHKVRIVVSDTHIGAGQLDAGNLLEDFAADSEWAAMLAALTAESQANGTEMELIINGDWFEYLQVPPVAEGAFDPLALYPEALYVQRSEAAAQQQTALIYAGHRGVFDSLRDFLSAGSAGNPRRSLTVLFGNHDPEVEFAAVQEQVRGYLGASGGRAELLRFGGRSYLEDGVYIEHGNAYTEGVNRFTNPDLPFDPLDPALVEHPFGSLVVSYFYNEIERDRFWIDAVVPLPSVLFYSLAFDTPFAVRMLRSLGEADPQFIDDVIQSMRADGASEAEISGAQRVLNREVSLAEAIEEVNNSPDLWRRIADTLLEQEAISPVLAEEVANAELTPVELANRIQEEANNDLEKSADILAAEHGAQVVCFGHVHEIGQKRLPDSNAIYLNTGTWINNVDFHDASLALWFDLVNNPDTYTNQRNLAYARIEHDAQGQLLSAGLYSA